MNTDYCALGDARTVIHVAAAADFVCPECARPLGPVARWNRVREAMLLALGVLTVIGSAATGFYTGHFPAGERAWQRVLAVAAPPHVARVAVSPPPPVPVVTILSYARFVPKPQFVPVVTVLAQSAVEVLGTASFTALPPKPVRVVLRLAGSDILTHTAGPLLAQAYLKARGETDIEASRAGTNEIRVTGTGGDYRDTLLVSEDGSSAGLAALAQGEADIVLTARPAADDELAAVSNRAEDHLVAQVPVAVIVNAANPLAQLTFTQVQAVFGGNARLTGIARRYASDDMSGADTGLAQAVVAGIAIGPQVGRMKDGRAVADAVAADPGGIGLVPMGFVGANRVVGIGGAVPGHGQPMLLHDLRLVLRGKAPGEEARAFMAFVLGARGQAVLAACGFLKPRPVQNAARPAARPTARKPAPIPVPPAAKVEAALPEKDPFDGMQTLADTTHVFTLPANGRIVPGTVENVKLTGDPAREAAGPVTPLPAPSPAHGLMKIACTIELTGVPSHCQVQSAQGTRSGASAVLNWLTSGQVRYAPTLKNGKPVVATRELTVSYRPPGAGG